MCMSLNLLYYWAWLNKNAPMFGHATLLDCVGYFSIATKEFTLVSWHMCSSKEYYICERNSTDMEIFFGT